MMIKKEEVIKIGRILKPHGIHGELAFEFDMDVFDEGDPTCVILEFDGILVPFFIKSYRLKNHENGLLLLENIDTEEDAKELIKADMYILRSELSADTLSDIAESPDYFVGYTILDGDKTIGKIVSVDYSTENVLWNVVSENNEELLIPVSEEFITTIDDDNFVLHLQLPEGLLELF
jgi:16S rRNA processing protein RimM